MAAFSSDCDAKSSEFVTFTDAFIVREVPFQDKASPSENSPLALVKNGVLLLLNVPVPINILSETKVIPPIEPSLASTVPSTERLEPSQDRPEFPDPTR